MTYTIAQNKQYNSYEIIFDGKPDAATREKLKAAGYRWHGVRRLWYGYKDIAGILGGAEICTTDAPKKATAKTEGQKAAAEFERQRQNELRAEYREGLKRVYVRQNGQIIEDMVDYCDKKAAYFVRLENGRIYAIEKPKIQTDFCFGYGLNGVTTAEDYENAENCARVASENSDYFLSENLADFDKLPNSIKSRDCKIYSRIKYNRQTADNPLADLFFADRWHNDDWQIEADFEPITTTDKKEILNGFEIVRKAFEKRLQTYLKRYGTSKLHTWSYLVD